MKNFGILRGVNFFLPQSDLMGHPILSVKLCSKTILYRKISSIQMRPCKNLLI